MQTMLVLAASTGWRPTCCGAQRCVRETLRAAEGGRKRSGGHGGGRRHVGIHTELSAVAQWAGSLKRDAGSRVSAQRNDWLNGGADTREATREREGCSMNRGSGSALVGVVEEPRSWAELSRVSLAETAAAGSLGRARGKGEISAAARPARGADDGRCSSRHPGKKGTVVGGAGSRWEWVDGSSREGRPATGG